MASKKSPEPAAKAVGPEVKIANLLALLLVKDAKPVEAILTLTRAGFSATEVADLLRTTTGNVNQQNYMARKVKLKRKDS